MAFKKIPVTSVMTYVSGLHALNLDLRDGTGYDWHFMNYWLGGKSEIKLYGKGQETDTNPIYGYYGVADRASILNEMGLNVKSVFVADHHRAILDLVYENLSKYKMIGYAKGCVEDYFFEEKQGVELLVQLMKMRNYLDEERGEILNEWLSREFRSIYRSWDSGRLQAGAFASYSPDSLQNK